MSLRVVLGGGRAWKWHRVGCGAEAEVVRLDGEDVREVGRELELDVELELAGSEVATMTCSSSPTEIRRLRTISSSSRSSPPASGLRLK